MKKEIGKNTHRAWRTRAPAAFVALLLLFAGCAPGEKAPEAVESPPLSDPPVVSPAVPETEPVCSEEPTPPVPSEAVEPEDGELVSVLEYIPDIYVDLKYATQDNFTGEVIYDFTEASLRYGTVKKLAAVQQALAEQGYSLKIWDAYRPVRAQFALWEVCPDPTYVADPNRGYSGHSRGNTVDVTLVTADGAEIEMPTGFDDFSAAADRNYSDVSETAAENARLLESLMTAWGFAPYSGEWWHFSDTTAYPVIS